MVYVADENLILVVDLGADLIAAYRLDPAAGRLAALGSSTLPAGFGPRHLVVLPADRLAVAGELTGRVRPAGAGRRSGRATVLDVRPASDVTESPAAPSGIGRTADGRFVVMANRGPDTVASFAVRGERLARVDEIPGGGENPRDLTVLDDRVYVANQESDSITVLRLDLETGALGATGSRFGTPSPTQVLPIPGEIVRPTRRRPPANGADMAEYPIVRFAGPAGAGEGGPGAAAAVRPEAIVSVDRLLAGPRGAVGWARPARRFSTCTTRTTRSPAIAGATPACCSWARVTTSRCAPATASTSRTGSPARRCCWTPRPGWPGSICRRSSRSPPRTGRWSCTRCGRPTPCVEFSRFCLRQEPSPVVDADVRQALAELDHGARGYRAVAANAASSGSATS